MNTVLEDLPLNIRHFKSITEQITVRLNSGGEKTGWKSIEFIITDVKTTNALSPSSLLTQIHRANKSLSSHASRFSYRA